MSGRERWKELENGIAVPKQHVFIPWFCSPEQLYAAFPHGTFWLSVGGCWPTARLKLFGFSGAWGFNFVSVPGHLSEIQFRNENSRSCRRTYRRSRPALQRHLGRPNVVDHGLLGQQTWAQGDLRVENHLAHAWKFLGDTSRLVHHLAIRKGGYARPDDRDDLL